MKHRNWKCKSWLAAGGVGMAAIAILLAEMRSTGQPALTAYLISTNQIGITITNAVPGTTYEIQRRLLLGDTNYPWRTYLVGTNTQTNFVADMGIDLLGFFVAVPCTDCDGDGVPNWADPQPANAAVSNLVLTIDTPANGSTVP